MAKKSAKKYYVVWRGLKPGIYHSWDEAKEQVSGYVGAEYKSFTSLADAEEAFNGNYLDYKGKATTSKKVFSKKELEEIGDPILNSLSVDAACSGNPGILEYRGVYTETETEVFRRGPYPDGTVNIGEFLAIVLGLAWQQKHKLNMPIYSDSRTAISWVKKKKVNTKLKKSKKNEKLFYAVAQAQEWLKNNKIEVEILKWRTDAWGEIKADFGRK
jgi:ribonuclease HI